MINMKRPTASLLLLDSAHNFISLATEHYSPQVKEVEASMDWLIASLLSKSHLRRIFAIGSLSSLYSTAPVEQTAYDFALMKQMIEADGPLPIPKNITDLLAQYGSPSYIHVDIASSLGFKNAMRELEQTHDFYTCGVKVANLLMLDDNGIIVDGDFSPNSGLKITRFAQALSICARTLESTKCDDLKLGTSS